MTVSPKLPTFQSDSFYQVLDTLADMVLIKGPQSRLLWANQAFCQFYGMTNAELKGIIDAPFSAPDNTQKFVKDDALVFESGKPLDIPEESVNRPDGTVRLFHTVKSPIFDSENKVIMTVGVSRDITERKIALENLQIERERASNSAKMASLGAMAGSIAHEINTPLAAIIMVSELSTDLLNEETPNLEIVKKNISTIDKTAERIAKIVSGLKSFSRESKHDPMSKTKLTDLVGDVLALSRDRIISNGIELKVGHIDESLLVNCRPAELGQVLLNLLNNSNDAICGRAGAKWISLETKKSADLIEITVTDSGNGIGKEVGKELFKPFFTTKDAGKGTGLGLSISKGIVESHGGTIFVDCECPNTRFVVRLPLVA